MPCAHGGQQCDRDPPFEQRQRSARSRGFGGARGVLESATPRGAGRRNLALVRLSETRFSAESEFWHPSGACGVLESAPPRGAGRRDLAGVNGVKPTVQRGI